MSPLLAPTRRQLEAFLDREPQSSVLGVRSPVRRPWPEYIERHGHTFRIVWCESPLEVREALTEAEGADDTRLIVITNLQETQLGADVVARFPRSRLITSSRWDGLRAAFSARDLDPRLRGQEWLCDLLLDRPPQVGYSPVPGGVLDLNTAWRFCLEHAVGLPDARADVDALLAWATDDGNLEKFQSLPQLARDKILEKLGIEGGGAAALVSRAISAGRGSDALAIGLVCGVIFTKAGTNEGLRDAAVRLEPLFGGASVDAVSGNGLAEAASRVIGRLDGASAHRHQMQASALLETVRASEHAALSSAMSAGFEARLVQTANAIERAATSGNLQDIAEANRLARCVLEHERATEQRPRVERLLMAARLCRWLSLRRRPGQGFDSAAKFYAEEGSFVDWGRVALRAGDSLPSVSSAYARICEIAKSRREEENKSFSEALRDWNSSGSPGNGALPIETALDKVIAPVASHAPVLLLVLDGLSFAVARPLVADIKRQGWVELAPKGTVTPPLLVAALPTITEVSRTSLLSGRLARGDAASERASFGAHQALRGVSRAGKPPVLFHKAALGTGPELDERVRGSIADPSQRIVGIVHNAVDSQLAGSDQVEILWSTDVLRQLSPLLRAARDAGRIVILTGDHGHVIDSGTIHVQGSSSDRWRSHGRARDGELEVREGRVLSPDGSTAAVLAWSEGIRYASKRTGYHGGASPQEVLVPLAMLTSGAAPNDWVEAPPNQPTWWDIGATIGVEAGALNAPAGRTERPRQSGLFDPRPPADSWVDVLLSSKIYLAQRGIAGRGAPDDAVVKGLISALAARGGRLSRTAFAQAVKIPEFRIPGLVNAAKRVLNVDQLQVLSIEASSNDILLDIRLLKTQFEVGDGS